MAKKLIHEQIVRFWNTNWNPYGIIRNLGYYGARQATKTYLHDINKNIKNKGIENPEEIEALLELVVQTSSRPTSTLACAPILIELGAFAKIPI